MNSPTTPCSMSVHQAIMKCPWQWRQPFLDERRESRKRKVGDGYFYDPVDPSFVDHLLPGYAKKFCGADVLESDEKENIQREIERLMTKKSDPLGRSDDGASADDASANDKDDFDVSRENQELVDSILLMSKSVEASSLTLLASPKSVASSSPSSDEGSDDDELELSSSGEEPFDLAEDRPAKLIAHRSSSLELVSDNLQEAYFAVEDSELLDFQAASSVAVETD
ncbi:hypothetical protein PHYPSEUDO_009217 [Phytophthora pseudosyringae]|uniref:Uncharacterized protein n=1 Tax=Phytophthora pseudosyringae TaxID=221518 RepID=A0A8T1WED0_9STRA|nr:hypothetical protein PHYPSEUDO_009217 [Phytophthora pseudosyringae]